MPSHTISARPPRGERRPLQLTTDPDRLASYLADASHFPGGHCRGLVAPESEMDVAAALAAAPFILPIGAQSSLTGGATPMGELVLSTSRLNRILAIEDVLVQVEAGVTLAALDEALAAADRCYPPQPTFKGACVGGIVATNAAGAATFKHGTTRDWVQALTVVLPGGDVLDVERGRTMLHADGYFDLELSSGLTRVEVPRYTMPRTAKLSAGYYAAPAMDLIDLFIGAEGTLGVVTAATLRIVSPRPVSCLALVPFPTRESAMAFVGALRESARAAWQRDDAAAVDVSAIEHMDARSLALLREDSVDRHCGVHVPDATHMAVLVTIDLPPGTDRAGAFDAIAGAADTRGEDSPLGRFCQLLAEAGVLDDVDIALPGDARRAAQLLEFREAVPAAVNRRVGRAQRDVDPRIQKVAADMIVPFDRLEELFAIYDDEFQRRGLDAAVWGHVSDGNLHPNVIPRSYVDVESGKEAILSFGREVVRMGGAPLAEHGVGRNPIKQQLLRSLYGDAGVAAMRRVKQAIDPQGKLAPGVLFSRPQ